MLSALAQKLGLAEPLPTEGQIRDRILTWATPHAVPVAVQRASQRASIRLGVSVPRKASNAFTNLADAKALFQKVAREEHAKAEAEIGELAAAAILEEEYARTKAVVDSGDVSAILALFPGKELLAVLAPLVGCANAHQVARAASRHLQVSDHKHLLDLRTKLNVKLALEQS